jgi:hypothetical protein
MTLPFHAFDATRIVELLSRELDVVSLHVRRIVGSANWEDPWQMAQQILSDPLVYETFKISTLPKQVPFRVSYGMEVIGTLAHLLKYRSGIHSWAVETIDEAIAESRRVLDPFYRGDYQGALALSSHTPWCSWFIGEEIIDETLLIPEQGGWWLLTVTGTD